MASTTALSSQKASGSLSQASSTSTFHNLPRPVSSAIAAASTPSSKSKSQSQSQPEATATPSPGRWRHPTFDEIIKRRKQTTFDDSNIRTVAVNGLVLIASWWWTSIINLLPSSIYNALIHPIASSTTAWPYIWLAIQCLLGFNIFRALRPLFLPPDNVSDIDLNARQRSLLGLDPKATPPPTSKTTYVTPPKYPRSATSTPGSAGSNSSMPGSTPSRAPYPLLRHASDSNASQRSVTNAGSPLWKRTMEERRSSLGFGTSYNSPLQHGSPGLGRPASTSGTPPDIYASQDRASPSPNNSSWRFVPARSSSRGIGNATTPPSSMTLMESGSVFAPNTPSPAGRGSSVPLNSRWLYERTRNSGGIGDGGYSS